MSFLRYSEYKDSGVEWLGAVPAHWSIAPFKRLVAFQNGADHKAVEVDHGYPVYGSGGLFAQASDYLYDGESVLLGRKGTIDKPLHVNGKFWTVDTMYWTRIREGASGRFCYYSATSFPFAYYSTNTALPSMTQSALGAHWVAYPPKEEQTAIAAFLDRETAKIDALVAEQETLIALLKEKRQAVISHAVTKGLTNLPGADLHAAAGGSPQGEGTDSPSNPDAPMKPSGIEWLGDVPAHWEVRPLRRVISKIEQGWSPDCFSRPADDGEWGVLKAGCVNRGVFNEAENKALPPEHAPEERYEVRTDDVLMSRASGSPELVGSTALVETTRPQLMLSDKIFRIHLNGAVTKLFFVAALNSRPLRSQIEVALSGGNGMANNLPQSALLEFFICVPPRSEQADVTDSISRATDQIGTLVAEAERAITLLKERRSALISAAVTGQIDVRDLVPAEAA